LDLGFAHGAEAAPLSKLVIVGNQFSMHGDCTAIRFPSDQAARRRISHVEIGVNSSDCPRYVSGFDESMGRIAAE
jgi:hypothetical protein